MNVFELVAKLTLDTSEYDNQLKSSENSIRGFSTKLANGVGKGLATAAKVGAAAVGAAAVAVAGMTKAAIDQYAEYEQLTGGIETLYKGSADQMVKYAGDAFKTAGLSMNEYMSTAIESSAAMINSLGGDTKQAAELTNMAIIDMADNVNKMGTTMEAVQNAYRGFSKGNYMMLDNLALGFAGTRDGMEQLLKKAEEISGFKYDISSYSDIVKAIHVVQDEMGITGTTAREAATTIQGSLSAMKSAWTNLLTGLSGGTKEFGQDIDKLIDDLIDSLIGYQDEAGKRVGGVINNIMPQIEKTLTGIGKLIDGLAPILAEKVPQIITSLLPSLISAAGTLVSSFIQNLPMILQAIGDAIPEIMNQIFNSIESILPSSLIPAFEKLRETINGVIEYLSNLDESQLQTIITIAEVVAAVMGIIAVMGTVMNVISSVSAVIGFMASPIGIAIAAITALVAIGVTVAKHWDEIKAKFIQGGQELKQDWENMKQSWQNMVQALSQKMQELGDRFRQGYENMKSAAQNAVSAIQEAMSNIRSRIQETIQSALSWGRDLINNFVNGIRSAASAVGNAVSSVASTVKGYLGFSEPDVGPLSNFHTYAPDMMRLFAKGITENEGLIEDAFNKSLELPSPTINTNISASYGRSGFSEQTREIVLNITELIDGSVLARNQYRYNLDEADRHGGNLINAYA